MEDMDFFERTGKMALGSRLRLLTDTITKDASLIYDLYGVNIKPKWFPVFYSLSFGEAKTITAIAREIRQTHPSVSNIVKEMISEKLVREVKDKTDLRRNMITLSSKGQRMAEILNIECEDVSAAIDKLSKEARHDLWKAVEEWEYLLTEKSLLQRVKEEKRARERKDIRIVPYEQRFHQVFRQLNEEWIMKHWELEEADHVVLDDPQKYILDEGGYIFVALYKEIPVGVCALCKMDDPDYDYEWAKYAVSPSVQGKGIGLLLGQAVVEKAVSLGAKKIFLESNTLLKPAIHIYRKLGFKELAEYHTSYERGDIQMELILKEKKQTEK